VHRGNSASSVRHREVRDGGLAVIYVTVEAGWAKELFFSQLSAAASLSRVAGRESRVLPPQTETAMARCRSISSEGDPYFILAREGAFYRDVARRIRLLLLKKFARTFKRERERERERERSKEPTVVVVLQSAFIRAIAGQSPDNHRASRTMWFHYWHDYDDPRPSDGRSSQAGSPAGSGAPPKWRSAR